MDLYKDVLDAITQALKEDLPLGDCPFYRGESIPGTSCGICYSEPMCQTNEPTGGWPTIEEHVAEYVYDMLKENWVS